MEYFEKLSVFYESERIGVKNFDCPYSDACLKAVSPRPLHRGAEAHVGSLYGMVSRIVIVSLDTGNSSKDLTERREIIENLGTRLNPHMKGTTTLVRGLLEEQIPVGASPHPYYAMINAAKCSGADGKRDMVPSELYKNCQPYALREIFILNPQLIVTQGKKAAETLGRLEKIQIDRLKQIASGVGDSNPAIDWLVSLGNEFLKIKKFHNGSEVIVLQTPHPSSRNGSWQQFMRISMNPITALIKELNQC